MLTELSWIQMMMTLPFLPILQLTVIMFFRNQMETLDFDAQNHERLSSQACENVLRERHLLRAWHHAVLQSNSQQNNNSNNNNNNSRNLLPNYGKVVGKEGGAMDQYVRGIRDRYYVCTIIIRLFSSSLCKFLKILSFTDSSGGYLLFFLLTFLFSVNHTSSEKSLSN